MTIKEAIDLLKTYPDNKPVGYQYWTHTLTVKQTIEKLQECYNLDGDVYQSIPTGLVVNGEHMTQPVWINNLEEQPNWILLFY